MLVTPAYAQAAGGAAGGAFGGLLVPMLLVFGIMYFFLIRPQQKKLKEHEAMLNALRRGDQVVTQGGIIAKVTKVKDDGEVELEIAQGVKVRVVRSSIATVVSKTEPAKGAKPAKDKAPKGKAAKDKPANDKPAND
ncbi:MAG TPA: preprotein translocase subunit YajC [Aliiroseovarius sp.]|nr:preprotein translocase subunit YajC [Aliiroseovarius sp.]